jgi:hypothetical protein
MASGLGKAMSQAFSGRELFCKISLIVAAQKKNRPDGMPPGLDPVCGT